LKHWLQDEAIGAIVAKLKDAGLYENTVIVMLGDNGAPAQGGRSKNFLRSSYEKLKDYWRRSAKRHSA
jgi:arylsulfatase A-like enzyme